MAFQIPSDFHSDERTIKLLTSQGGKAAIVTWLRAGAWCAENGTHGHVTPEAVKELWIGRRRSSLLVEQGWWYKLDKDEGGGFRFPDWHEHQELSLDRRWDHLGACGRALAMQMERACGRHTWFDVSVEAFPAAACKWLKSPDWEHRQIKVWAQGAAKFGLLVPYKTGCMLLYSEWDYRRYHAENSDKANVVPLVGREEGA